ncbi:MAG: hypothetical protein FWF91_04295 [Coriobacteriia bacterium]|nr:hypothetical protein [Coriobacteriia bacterium]
MAKKNRSKGQSSSHNAATPRKEQSKSRRLFTIIICVVVALGLMLPVTGLGFASCSQRGDDPRGVPTGTQEPAED